MTRMLSILCALALLSIGVTGCDGSNPTEPRVESADDWWAGISAAMPGADLSGTTGKGGPGGHHVDVKGLNIVVPIDSPGNPFDTNLYRFHAKSIGDRITGRFRTRGEGPGGIFGDARGEIVCVGVAPDGKSAWLGGLVTRTEGTTIPGAPDFEGLWVIWSVGLSDDGSALASNTFLGVPEEAIALDHCSTGFPLALEETTGIVQIRTLEHGFGLGEPAGG